MGMVSTSSQPQGGFETPPVPPNLKGPAAQGSSPGRDPYAGMRFGPTDLGPIQSPMGWDFSSPGQGEQFFGLNQMRWMAPGQASQWWGQNQDEFSTPGAMEDYYRRKSVQGQLSDPTRSAGFFDQFQKQDPGLGAYYDRAKERTSGSLNEQLAARGGFGSSAGVDQLSQAITDLDAQRANREADFNLQQTALGGQLANQADLRQQGLLALGGQLAGQAQSQMLSRLGQAGQLAMGADAADLSRLGAGMNAAANAQQLRRQRGRDYMADMFNPSQFLMNFNQQGLMNMLNNDQDLLASVIESQLGLGRESLNQDMQNQAAHRGDIGMITDMMGSFMGGGMGG